MARYRIRMDVVLMGLKEIVIDDVADYEVGQKVMISPKVPMKVQDGRGSSVTVTPGISMSGTVTEKIE